MPGLTNIALTRGQRAQFTWRVSIYKFRMVNNRRTWDTTATYTDVPCLYVGTPNYSLALLQGRQSEANIMTADQWIFPASVDVGDNDYIKLTKGRKGVGQFWTIEGSPELIISGGRAQAFDYMVYSRLAAPPAGVT